MILTIVLEEIEFKTKLSVTVRNILSLEV